MCFCVAMLIIITQPLYVFAAVWDGSAQQPYVNSDGAYVINTPEKLKWISNQVNSGNNDINAVVTADLQLNSAGSTTNKWVPIGTADNPFLGSFYGGNHKISGLYINKPDLDNQGLFGYIGSTVTTTVEFDTNGDPYEVYSYKPSEIRYVVLENVNIKGASYVGGVAGYSLGGIIKDCSVSGTVTGSNNVGGITGHNRKMAVAENCLNAATVNGNIRVGGITGYNFSDAEVQGCCNIGVVNAASYVGGLVGTSSGSAVGHSYNKGVVNATVNQAGGLIGYTVYGDILGNYTIGTVNCPGELTGIAFGNVVYSTNISKCYYDKDHAAIPDSFATPAEYMLMQDEMFVASLNVKRNIFVTDYFLTNNGYPILRWQLTSWTGDLSRPSVNSEGEYLIGNGSELAWFAALVNGTLSGFPANSGADARLTKDILLNPDLFDETSNIWTPIGAPGTPYTGNFNGMSHRVRGIYISDETLYYAGLFGYVDQGGAISNIYTENSSINAGRYVAVLAGYNGGTITNCHNAADVEAKYYAGGIVGENYGTIFGCSNKGYINSNNYAGGIVGTNYSITENCCNTGYIYGTSRSGGIAGACFATIKNVYNKAGISGGNYVGGIVGELVGGTINAAYSYGPVRAIGLYTAAAIGYLSNSTASYCYYNSEISVASDNNAIGLTTAQMSASTSITAFIGFSGTSWVKRSSDMFFNYCPEIYVFYHSDDAAVREASKQSVKVLKPEYVIMDEVDGEINTYYTTLSSAANHIGGGEGTMVIIGDCSVPETIWIEGDVTITGDGVEHTIINTMGTSENMFYISGTLNIDAANNSTDDTPLLMFDGGRYNNLTGIAAFMIGADATMNLYQGAKITNVKTNQNGGAIFNNGGKFNMYGGIISNNITSKDGGAIYNNNGDIKISEGFICDNTADGNGGGIYFTGIDAEIEIEGVTISGNHTSLGSGGAIYNQNSTVYFKGGSVTDNDAYLLGGGLYNTGTFDMSGGTFGGNTASNDKGSAIYENGSFNMSADAYIEPDNNIYLTSGKTVVNTGKLLRSGVAAHLYPQNFAVGTKVLSGEFTALNYANFVADPQNGVTLHINTSGNLIDRESTNVCTLSAFGSGTVPYTSVKEAIEAVGSDTGIITMIDDDIIEGTINVPGHIQIVGDGVASRRLTRYHTCVGDMFTVQPGGSLDFGFVDTEDDSALIIDGSYSLSGLIGGAVVNNSGSFTLSDGATISNNRSFGNGGAVNNSGKTTIYGGKIIGCHAALGGAVYSSGGTESEPGLQIREGELCGNKASASGGAVAVVGGTYEFSGGIISENEAQNGGGIYIGDDSDGTLFDLSESYEEGILVLYTPRLDENGEIKLDEDHNMIFDTSEHLIMLDTLTRMSVSENTAAQTGGGIFVSNGKIDISGGNIAENSAKHGGGIAVGGTGEASFSAYSSYTLAHSYTLFYDEYGMPSDFEYIYSDSLTECSVSGNSAELDGGGIYIGELSTVDYTVCIVSVNTADVGSGIYLAGALTMNQDSFVAENNEIYLSGESVVNIGGAYSGSGGIIACLMIQDPYIGRTILTGVDVSDVNERFTVANSEFFYIADSGTLNTNMIVPQEDPSHNMTIDRENNILTGIPSDRSAESVIGGLVNNASDIVLLDANGTEIPHDYDGKVTTDCVIVLKENGVVVDSVVISVIGDVTRDGEYDGEDANIVSYVVAGLVAPQNLTAAQYRAADANNDGVVNHNDVLFLEQCGLLKAQASQIS